MVLEFVKMHGLGNDFIMLENIDTDKLNVNNLAETLCQRNSSVGADGIILICPSTVADTRMRIFNADGSEAEMCGNGIRCFAKYVYERKIVEKLKFKVETLAGIMEPELQLGESGKVEMVRVDMGKPNLERAQIPMQGAAGRVIGETISVNGKDFTITSMLMGVPHTVVFVDNIDDIDIYTDGPAIERHPLFPRKTNVNFVQVLNGSAIRVRTWERGAAATLACGTGACASAVASALNNKVAGAVNVELYLGRLFIEQAENGNVFMTGPAEEVFYGFISYNPFQ
jgi:diaminopimelate epimerase